MAAIIVANQLRMRAQPQQLRSSRIGHTITVRRGQIVRDTKTANQESQEAIVKTASQGRTAKATQRTTISVVTTVRDEVAAMVVMVVSTTVAMIIAVVTHTKPRGSHNNHNNPSRSNYATFEVA